MITPDKLQNFNAAKHVTKLRGKDYLEVKWRLGWINAFIDENPGWGFSIHLDDLSVIPSESNRLQDEARVIVTVEIYREEKDSSGDPMRVPVKRATGIGTETRKDFDDYVEKAETKAIGRALAAVGFGTQFTGEDEAVADSPVDGPKKTVAVGVAKKPKTLPMKKVIGGVVAVRQDTRRQTKFEGGGMPSDGHHRLGRKRN